MKISTITISILAFASAAAAAQEVVISASSGPTRIWTRLIGTSENDIGMSLATDRSRNVFLAGYTNGEINQPNQGMEDAVALSLNSKGCDKWQYQWGTNHDDTAFDLALTPNGQVVTCGNAGDGTQRGFVRKIDHCGKACWESKPIALHRAARVVVDRCGYISVVGRNPQMSVLCRIAPTGKVCWTRRIERDARTISVAADFNCNTYVAGVLGGQAAVVKFDKHGNECWRTLLNNGATTLRDIAVDNQCRIVVIGDRLSDRHPFVQTLKTNGTLSESVSFSNRSRHHAWRLAIDRCGAIYFSGSHGQPGKQFLVKISPSLKEQWWHWLGDGRGFIRGLAIDSCGDVLVSGDIDRSVHGQAFAGKRDMFVMKLRP